MVSNASILASALFVVVSASSAQAQFPPDSFTNLKVLPKEISQRELVNLMAAFTRALGVRCTHCHVGEEGQPLETYKFALDDKPAKQTARVMLEMVRRINDEHLTELVKRTDPAIKVECVTCHRGTTEPRMLKDVLRQAYDARGIDSLITAYHALRQRYYGRATYDFGEVSLADVAARLWDEGHTGDAIRLHMINVEMNPNSVFAKRQHATAAITLAFRAQDVEAGTVLYRSMRDRYGATVFAEFLMNDVGYRLLNGGQADRAIATFRLNVEAFPQSANAYDSLAEAYARNGERQLAILNYEKSLAINPANENARRRLQELRPAR